MKAAVRSGRLTDRVRLERDAGTTLDATGQPVADWRAAATRFAAVELTGGGEVYAADQTHPRRQYRVTLRKPLAVTESDRLVWLTGGNKVLNVTAVDDSLPDAVVVMCQCNPLLAGG